MRGVPFLTGAHFEDLLKIPWNVVWLIAPSPRVSVTLSSAHPTVIVSGPGTVAGINDVWACRFSTRMPLIEEKHLLRAFYIVKSVLS